MRRKDRSCFIGGILIGLTGAICFSKKAIFAKLAYRDTGTEAVSFCANLSSLAGRNGPDRSGFAHDQQNEAIAQIPVHTRNFLAEKFAGTRRRYRRYR